MVLKSRFANNKRIMRVCDFAGLAMLFLRSDANGGFSSSDIVLAGAPSGLTPAIIFTGATRRQALRCLRRNGCLPGKTDRCRCTVGGGRGQGNRAAMSHDNLFGNVWPQPDATGRATCVHRRSSAYQRIKNCRKRLWRNRRAGVAKRDNHAVVGGAVDCQRDRVGGRAVLDSIAQI